MMAIEEKCSLKFSKWCDEEGGKDGTLVEVSFGRDMEKILLEDIQQFKEKVGILRIFT